MFSKKQIDALAEFHVSAYNNYLNAIKSNLIEIGKPVDVVDWNGENGKAVGLWVEFLNDNAVSYYVIDKVKYGAADEILAHCSEYDGKKVDEWIYLSYIGDAMDYVLDGIDWESVVTD